MVQCSKKGLVVFLMGPTATGKSELAVQLFEKLPVELVSVDSAMVYRGMDIGSAKPDSSIRNRVPHALIDIEDPATAYSAGRFVEDALKEIKRIREANRIPLLVGGTMLYFRALSAGLADLPESSPQVREALMKEALLSGWDAMHNRLQAIDPDAAQRIHPNDSQRILRALEVEKLTGHTLSTLLAERNQPVLSGTVLKLALIPPSREELSELIAQRFQEMLTKGLVEEVAKLWRRNDLDLSLPSMRAVGYRQIGEYLNGQMSLTEAEERAVIATRQLAKRQMTWLRSEADLYQLEAWKPDLLSQAIHRIEDTLSVLNDY